MRLLRPLVGILLTSCTYAYTKLSDKTLKALPEPGDDFNIHDGALLAPILIPRVPGTPGSTKVLNHFLDFFRKELPNWTLEFQNSTQVTPTSNGKEIPFVNLIATRDPPWTHPGEVGRLALVAHYDSKLTPHGFIGATDSAAPCAMLLHAARSLDEALTKKWNQMEGEGFDEMDEQRGVQIILLDGEEAFKMWTDNDSLYGARSLAETWEQTFMPATSTFRTPLDSINLFLLLDLLGEKDPKVPSYFLTTHWAYRAMANLENRLRSLKQVRSSPNHPSKRTVSTKHHGKARVDQERAEPVFMIDGDKEPEDFRSGMIQDDHVPFMQRGVEILHIIPSPFPRVWHEIEDDGQHLDMDTVEDWALLVTAFAAEWMDLEGFFDTSKMSKRDMPGGAGAKKKRSFVTSKTELATDLE